jgi:hypothetical protein
MLLRYSNSAWMLKSWHSGQLNLGARLCVCLHCSSWIKHMYSMARIYTWSSSNIIRHHLHDGVPNFWNHGSKQQSTFSAGVQAILTAIIINSSIQLTHQYWKDPRHEQWASSLLRYANTYWERHVSLKNRPWSKVSNMILAGIQNKFSICIERLDPTFQACIINHTCYQDWQINFL